MFNANVCHKQFSEYAQQKSEYQCKYIWPVLTEFNDFLLQTFKDLHAYPPYVPFFSYYYNTIMQNWQNKTWNLSIPKAGFAVLISLTHTVELYTIILIIA
jgi:hypothetical protein